jgi:hypothetical protein
MFARAAVLMLMSFACAACGGDPGDGIAEPPDLGGETDDPDLDDPDLDDPTIPDPDIEVETEGTEPEGEPLEEPELPPEPELPAEDELAPSPEPAAEPAPEPAGSPACKPNTKTYVLRHLQASMQRTDSLAQRRASIDAAFAAGAHTISWTEIENEGSIARIHNRSGWGTYWPSGKPVVMARNAVPVSWRKDTFKFLKGKHWRASDGLAEVSPSRWVTRVWLEHIPTGRIQSRIAHHSVSGVDGGGKPPVQWRRKMHLKNIAKFKDVMQLGERPVVGSADFNTVRLRDLLGNHFKYDVPSSGGSHGSRLIDWVVRRPHPDLSRTGVTFVKLGTSDHRGVRATYDYKPALDCN